MLNKEYININTLNNCASFNNPNLTNGSPLVLSTCTGSLEQKFLYNPRSHEIKMNDKCLQIKNDNNGTPIELWPCNNSKNQKWIYDKTTSNFKSMDNVNKCMEVEHSSIKNGTPIQINTCNNNANQKFILTKPITSRIPLIIRSNIVIPQGTLPIIQLSKVKPYHVLFYNDRNENILIKPGITIDKDNEELKCLNKNNLPFEKIVTKFILGPLSILRATYYSNDKNKTIIFANNTTEHDLIYDQSCFNETMKYLLSEIYAYDINSSSTFKISKTYPIPYDIFPGTLLVMKYDSKKSNFRPINEISTITKNENNDYILGAYTFIILGNFIFYNSSDKPLYYQALEGI